MICCDFASGGAYGMNKEIESTVAQCQLLKVKENIGARHRISHSGVRSGSLWVTPMVKCYCVCPTGEVETLLYNYLCSHFGTETGVDQSRKYWNIENYGDVAKVIRRFGES
jgi:hypothetical protein